MSRKKALAAALIALFAAAACATQFAAGGRAPTKVAQVDAGASGGASATAKINALFAEAGVDGTLVMRRASDGRTWTHDSMRAAQRRAPASTFKILNALIALETGVVSGVDVDVFEWDGAEREFADWNRDHTLRSAFQVSAVWVFQDIARRIGAPRMAFWVGAADYGDETIGARDDIGQFWLKGPLSISANEQVAFLDRLATHASPFSDAVETAVIDLMEIERGDGWVLRGKTGWATGDEPDLGWFVGWLETDADRYAFALNIDMPDPNTDRTKRIALARAALTRVGAADLGDAWREAGAPAN